MFIFIKRISYLHLCSGETRSCVLLKGYSKETPWVHSSSAFRFISFALSSNLNCAYFNDDGILEGIMETFLHDLTLVEHLGSNLGFKLNYQKSELFCNNDDSRAAIVSSLQGAKVIDLSDASLLGSPIGSVQSIESSLREKIEFLRRMGSTLSGLLTQDALLVCHSFAIPKLIYILRASPCFLTPLLSKYDSLLWSIPSDILNIHLPDGDSTWIQAALSVRAGGIGIR